MQGNNGMKWKTGVGFLSGPGLIITISHVMCGVITHTDQR